MRCFVMILLFCFVIVGCATHNAGGYVDPDKSLPHARVYAINNRGFLQSDLLFEQINGLSSNISGRWSSSEARLVPGMNRLLVRAIDTFKGRQGLFLFDLMAEKGEEYKFVRADVSGGFEVSVYNKSGDLILKNFAKEEEITTRSTGWQYIPMPIVMPKPSR